VLGTNWGLVHVQALRRHGVRVVALCGGPTDADRTRRVAREQGIDIAISDPAGLLELHLDLITIATPAGTHPMLLRQFDGMPVICEKPLLGMSGDESLLPLRMRNVWLNFAFPFLGAARLLATAVNRLGGARRVEIDSGFDLPLTFTAPEWFLEVGIHPLSWAVHAFGPPRLVGGWYHDAPHHSATLELVLGDAVPVRVACHEVAGLDGIEHQVKVLTDGGLLELTGRFGRGSPWKFDQVLLDGRPVAGDETAVDRDPRPEGRHEDPWLQANVRSIGAALRAISGEVSTAQGLAGGLFTPEKARPIDDCARRAFG